MNTQKKIEEAQEYIRSAEKRCDSCGKKFGVDFLRRTHFPFPILISSSAPQLEDVPAEMETRLRRGSG